MKVAVLSNINLDSLKPFLFTKEHYFCSYGRYMEELIEKKSYLNTHKFEFVLLHLEGEELIKEISNTLMTTEEVRKIVGEKMNLILQAVENYMQEHRDSFVVITTILLPPFMFLNYLDTNSEYSLRALGEYINQQIIDFSMKSSRMYVLDWKRIVLLYGYKEIIDEKFWYLGRMKYTNKAYKVLASEIQNIVNAIQGRTKKVLVVDLDNTLWGGIIGEDGISGIELSEDGIGKAYRDFQYTIKSLMDLGILLAINSKNNPEDIDEVFVNHPMMVLQKEDFVSIKVNWSNKIENMKEIAQELNLGLDSFVFIDDNPREREIIKEHLPQVAVPDFPPDPAYLKRWFLEEVTYTQFPKVFVTQEDRRKIGQYKAHIKRNELSRELHMDKFIKSLDIELGFYVNDKRFIRRTAQLTQKTNQFNMTTKRYTEADIERFIKDGDIFIFNFDYRDKFGFEGIIGTSIVKKKDNCGYVDSFLMSCRIIGRNVEYAFLYKIIDHLKGYGVQEVMLEFVPTKKNVVAKDFYKNLEFAYVEQKGNSIYFRDNTPAVSESLRKSIEPIFL